MLSPPSPKPKPDGTSRNLSAPTSFLVWLTLFDIGFLFLFFLIDRKFPALLLFILAFIVAVFWHLPVYAIADALRRRLGWPPLTILLLGALAPMMFSCVIWLVQHDPATHSMTILDVFFYGLSIHFPPSLPMGLALTIYYYWKAPGNRWDRQPPRRTGKLL